MTQRIRTAGILILGLGLALGVAAQEKPKKAAAKPASPPDEKAEMEAWQKAMTPGEGQKKLEPFVGTFDVRVRTWTDPSKPPEDTSGTSVNSWVLGDRYVQMKYDGVFMGENFNGIGFTGFDNITKKYQSVWMDTANTCMISSSGAFDAGGKTLTLKGTNNDPLTGKAIPFEERIAIADADHHSLEMWAKRSDGKMSKMMEIQYTRKKP